MIKEVGGKKVQRQRRNKAEREAKAAEARAEASASAAAEVTAEVAPTETAAAPVEEAPCELRQFFSDDAESSDDERFHRLRKTLEDDMLDTGMSAHQKI